MPFKMMVCLLSALTFSAQAQFETRVDQAATKLAAEVPGLAITIAVDGKIAYAKGFGSASPTAPRPITPDTQFRTASVSKPITAAAVFKLVEQRQIDLDKPARDYCPAVAPLNGAPTVRHFLQHQSGMRHTSDPEDESIVGAFPRLAPALTNIVKERLRFSPGQKTLYTSWGYAVLGCVIETVSKQSYADFVKANVFGPARMRDTAFDAPDYAAPAFTQGFVLKGRTFQPSAIVDTRFKTPASGVISTTNDLARFTMALFDRSLLPEPLVAEMLAVRKAPDDENPIFTAGWTIGPVNLGTPAFNYNGSMEGTTAVVVMLPERRVAVTLLTNRERFVPGVMPAVREALRAVLGLPPA